MPLKDVKYKYNQSIIKVFGYGENKKIKVITMNCLRTAGIEDDSEIFALRNRLIGSITPRPNLDLFFLMPYQKPPFIV